MVAAGAGSDALTLRVDKDTASVLPITQSLFAMDVDDILKSEAFGLVSTYSPDTEKKLTRLSELQLKLEPLNQNERQEQEQLSLFVQQHNPYGIDHLPSKIENQVHELARKLLK